MRKCVLCVLLVLALVLPTAAFAADYPADKMEYNVYIRMRPMNGDANDMEIFKTMEEISNVHLNFTQIPQADWSEKIPLMLNANQDLPDALYSGYALNSTEIVTYGSQGILLALNDYIEEYMPNFSAVLEKHPEVKGSITAPDGNIYSLPFVRMAGMVDQIPENMFINKVWLDNLDLEVPTTIDELEEVLTAFKENDANGNGDPDDEIPMTFKFLGSQRDLGGLFGMFGYADSLYEGQNHFVVDNGEVIFVPATEGYKEACSYLYEHFFSKGLIDLEGFTMSKATYNAQNQGEIANIGSYFSWNIFDLGTVHMDEYVPMAPLTGPNGTTSWGYKPSAGIETAGLILTHECKNPEYLLMWADLCYDDYYGMQLEYGLVGKHLVDNGDGTYSYGETPEGQTYDEYVFGDTYPDSCLSLFPEFYENVLPLPVSAQAKDQINRELYLDVATTIYYPTLMLSQANNEEVRRIGTDIIKLAEQKRAKWLAYGGVEEEWDEYMATLEDIGLERYIQIYQETYDVAYGK